MKKTPFIALALTLASAAPCLAQETVSVATYGNAVGNNVRTMTMALTHTADYVAFTTDLVLPEGTTVTAVTARRPLKNNGTVNLSAVGGSATESTDFRLPFQQKDNTCRIMGYNLGEVKIEGATGDVMLTVTLSTTTPIAYDAATVTATNITFVRDDLEEVTLPNAVTSSRLWGDVNMDQKVDVKDYQAVGNIIVGKPAAGADLFAADMIIDAEEVSIDVKDYQKLSNTIVGK